MKKQSEESLINFINMSTWDKKELESQDEDRFLNFIVESYKNDDKDLTYYEIKDFIENHLGKEIKDSQAEQINILSTLYLRGIKILDKYTEL